MLGLTDPAEYTARFGVSAEAAGDLSLDGQFDFDDIGALVNLLGKVAQSGMARSVPEPSGGTLVAILLATAFLRIGTRAANSRAESAQLSRG